MNMTVIAWLFLLGAIGYGVYNWANGPSSDHDTKDILLDEEE